MEIHISVNKRSFQNKGFRQKELNSAIVEPGNYALDSRSLTPPHPVGWGGEMDKRENLWV